MNTCDQKKIKLLLLFKKIVKKVTELSSGYDPEYFFDKNNLSESDFKHLKDIADSIQLPNKAHPGLDYGNKESFITQNKYNFLFFDNPYLKLLQYIHSEEFTSYQTERLQLYLGWFSYVDKESSLFRYLVSTQSLPSDRGKAFQHLSLRAFFYNTEEQRYIEEQPHDLQNITDVFYFSQKRERPASVDFVQILRDSFHYKQKRLA